MNFYQRMAWGIFSMLAVWGFLPQALAATEPVVLRIYAPPASSAAAKPAKELANGPLVASLPIDFFKKLDSNINIFEGKTDVFTLQDNYSIELIFKPNKDLCNIFYHLQLQSLFLEYQMELGNLFV